jgi:hypothetical protein
MAKIDRYATARDELAMRMSRLSGRRKSAIVGRAIAGYAIVSAIAVCGTVAVIWLLSFPLARTYVACSAGVAVALLAMRSRWLAALIDTTRR